MKLIDIDDLHDEPEQIHQPGEEAAALACDGKPFALVVALREGEDPAEVERLVRRGRARAAVSRIRRGARAAGLDRLGPDEIDAEIRAARAERKRWPRPADG